VFISHRYQAIFIHIQRTGGNAVQTAFEEQDPELVQMIPIDPAKQRTKHCFATDIRAAVGEEVFGRYTTFCVVRNRFDRLVSWYSMFKQGWGHDHAAVKLNPGSPLLALYNRGLPLIHRHPRLTAAYVRIWSRLLARSRPGGHHDGVADGALRHMDIGARVMAEVNRRAASFDDFVRLTREHPQGLFERLYTNQWDFIADGGDRLIVDEVLRFERLAEDFARLAQQLQFPGTLRHVNRSRRDADYRRHYNPTTRALIEDRFHCDIERLGYEF
jgi:hypothetical protein